MVQNVDRPMSRDVRRSIVHSMIRRLLLAATVGLFISAGWVTADGAPRGRKSTRIQFEVTPPSVQIFLDGRRLGAASEVGDVRVKPGRRVVRLVRGGDETELELQVSRGRTVRFAYEFGD